MASSPSPSKIDEPISPCRPRLTAEQTAYLEESYSYKAKPSTQEKKQHAEDLGLTQEKVNVSGYTPHQTFAHNTPQNWFQNRRAKSKQLTRNRHELSILTPDDPRLQHLLEHGRSAILLPSSPEHYSEFTDMPLALQHQGSLHGSLPRTPTWPLPESLPYVEGNIIGHPESFHALDTPLAVQGSMPMGGEYHDGDYSSASSAYQDSLPEYSFAPNSSAYSQHDAEYFQDYQDTSSRYPDLQSRKGQLLLQDPVPEMGQMPSGHALLAPAQEPHFAPSSNHSLRLQAATNNLSQNGALQHSPSPPTQPRSFSNSRSNSRRGSNHSDLVNHINTVRLQQTSPDEEVFKTPDLPENNLASRRKRQRPANLISQRAVSGPAAGEDSPRGKTAMLPQSAVRRIKSQGHNLNVLTGRVQKPGVQTPTRSPLTIGFLEGLYQDEAHAGPFPKELQPARIQTNFVSYPERNVSLATSPSSLGAPPLSASCTQASFDDTLWMASPPITPYFGPGGEAPVEVCADGGWIAGGAYGPAMEYHARYNDYGDVPLSAPAHITHFHFPGASSPSTHPVRVDVGSLPNCNGTGPAYLDTRVETNRNNSVPSLSARTETPFYAPQPLAPASQLPAAFEAPSDSVPLPSQPHSSHPQSQPHYQRIPRPSSSGNRKEAADWPLPNKQLPATTFRRPERHMNTFFAAPPAAVQKELEVVMARFPSPPKRPRAEQVMKGPMVLTWQNSGPGDFQATE